MKLKLFLLSGLATLLAVSTVTQGKLYINGRASDGSIPQSDCLEMMCPGENRCVEGGGTGHCCPTTGSLNQGCKSDGISINECCQSDKGLVCSNGKCVCPADKPIWNGTQCCFDVGCGCNVAKVNGCCPGVVDVGCGCGVAKVNGCCPGVVKGCDGVCGSGKTDIGCGCGVAKVNGCCPGVVKGCDGVCGSGKTNCGGGGGGLVPRPCPNCGRR